MAGPFILRLNGTIPAAGEARAFAGALADNDNLTATGGYLFKSRLDGRTIHISIVPAVSEGSRLHHYDITVPEGEHLLGSVSASGEFTILFRADREHWSEEARNRWRAQFGAFAGILLENGYDGPGNLDWITGQLLKESALFNPIPGTLGDIVASREVEKRK